MITDVMNVINCTKCIKDQILSCEILYGDVLTACDAWTSGMSAGKALKSESVERIKTSPEPGSRGPVLDTGGTLMPRCKE